MRGMRNITCVLAVALAAAAGACGGRDPGHGFGDSVDRARAAKTLSSLQTGLVTLSLVQADSGGAAVQDVAAALQAKDPANRYTTAAVTGTGVVQVLGGDGGPVMLVAISDPASEGRAAQYVAAWQGSGTTMYYAGTAAPAYTTEPPAGPGWGSTLPQ
ncbi:MAG: hypothetical protein ACRDLQ_00585 [Solirubrobacterales bacterium]